MRGFANAVDVKKVENCSGGGTVPERFGVGAKKRCALAVLATAFCAAAIVLSVWPAAARADVADGVSVARVSTADDLDGTEYSDIAAAWSAAQKAGTATVTLLADAEIAQTLTVADGMNITISGDGSGNNHSITSGTPDVPVFSMNGGSLTVGDGVEIKQGASCWATAVRVTGGEFTLAGGSIATYGSGLVIEQGGSAIMTSGSIDTGNGNYGVAVEGGSFALEGGDVNGTYYGGIGLHQNGSVVISDGTVTCSDGPAIYYYSGSLRIKGGTISGTGEYSAKALSISAFEGQVPDVKLSGGTLKVSSTDQNELISSPNLHDDAADDGHFTLRQLLADGCAYYSSEHTYYSVPDPNGSGSIEMILHGP